MNRLGFIVLSILEQSNATNKLTSMTLREVMEAEDLSYKENTIFKKISEFEAKGYICRGLKDGRAGTYYLTDAGAACLEREKMFEGGIRK